MNMHHTWDPRNIHTTFWYKISFWETQSSYNITFNYSKKMGFVDVNYCWTGPNNRLLQNTMKNLHVQ